MSIVALVMPDGPPLLPEQFWAERDALAHIRQAARARRLAPDAVFGAVLARFTARVDWRIRIPPIVARQGSLNVTIALIGQSGAGKGSALDEAAGLLNDMRSAPDHRTGETSVGSGEGFVKAYFEQVPDETSGRKVPPLVWRQERRGMLFRVDEGEILRQLGQRTGATLDQVLRSAWSGEALGGAYVGESGQRKLEAHSYRTAIVMGLQPELCRFLLDQAAGGTPQRMLWLAAASDPEAPTKRPKHPGCLELGHTPIYPAVSDCAMVDEAGLRCVELGVAESIVDEIENHHRQLLRGELTVDPLDAHRHLGMMKVAGLLALLDGRIDIDISDWWLAGLVDETSRSVREWVTTQLRQVERGRDRVAADRAGQRAEAAAVGDAAGRAAVDRVARLIVRHVDAGSVNGAPASRSELYRQMAGRDRRLFDAALFHAIDRRWVSEVGVVVVPGESAPSR